MKKWYSITLVTQVAMLFSGFLQLDAAANIPSSPVNQYIGMPDIVLNDLTAADCRICHDDLTPTSQHLIADRHHLMQGQIIPEATKSPFGNPGAAYDCGTCHSLVINASNTYDMGPIVRDCLECHPQIPGEASVHHLPPQARARECNHCHGQISNPRDGHYIPSYAPAIVTPNPGMGTGGSVGMGGCAFCHGPGTDTASGFQVASNADTHHNAGVMTGPFTGPFTANCALCHDVDTSPTTPPIRICEGCHSVSMLHNTQLDSNRDGTISSGRESAGYGHVGVTFDCGGCHENSPLAEIPSLQPNTNPPGDVATSPYIDAIFPPSIIAGKDQIITVSGRGLNYFALNLVHETGRQYSLTPLRAWPSRMELNVPYDIQPGNYRVNIIASINSGLSNTLALSVLPAFRINVTDCGNGLVTVTGNGFSAYFDAAGSGTQLSMDGTPCQVTSWNDKEITANCTSCGDEILVQSVFGTVSAPSSTVALISTECIRCHEDRSAALNCSSITWRLHERKLWVSSATYRFAELAFIGSPCRSARPDTTMIQKIRTRK